METAREDAAAGDAPPKTAPAYCRRCGYSLRGLQSGKCPECGGAFDLADRMTFARRPPRARVRWWAWRVSLLLVLLGLAAAAVPGWYYWQWRAEQQSLDTIRALGGTVKVRRVEAAGPARYLPERWAFFRDRASEVILPNVTAGQADRLDFRPLDRLESLSWFNSHVGDPALAQLRGMVDLKHLYLIDNPLDGSGLAHLADCGRLEYLTLGRTRLTDAGLAAVGRLASLRGLSLWNTAVTDAGLTHLAGLTSLETLALGDTAVTDDGLRHLYRMASLRNISLRDTKVTEQGRRDLRRALPNVRIMD